MKSFCVKQRRIGEGQSCFIIAEIGINHNGSREDLLRLVEAAAASGADAVKLQYFSSERLVSPKLMPEVCAFFKTVEITREDLRLAFERAEELGVTAFASVFHEEGLDDLLELGMPLIKIASGDVTNPPFLKHAAGKGVPILLSTGAASLEEIDAAVEAIRTHGDPPLCVMQCTSLYPTEKKDVNLAVIPFYRDRYRTTIGFSDHTLGIDVASLAAAAGARVYEKHFTLTPMDPRPDHALSLGAEEFREMVLRIREAEVFLGAVQKPAPREAETRENGRKSITAAVDLPAGHRLRREDLLIRRPAKGLPPSEIERVIGKELGVNLSAGECVTKEMLKL